MKKTLDLLTAHPARFFLLAAIIWGGLMCYLNHKDGSNFSLHDLLVEANGMFFDLLVFGILLSAYESLREKKGKRERIQEEIDDYKGWDEKEAKYRIVGAIRRLNKSGVYDINLVDCFLERAELSGVRLTGANLRQANLRGAKFFNAHLEGAFFYYTDMMGADFGVSFLKGATFKNARLIEANLSLADLRDVNFEGANLERANFEGAHIHRANFQGANLLGANVGVEWFEKLEYSKVIGKEEIKEKYLIDENGKLQLK